MGDSVSFVQILNTSELKEDKTAKFNQWENIEDSIKSIVPIKNSKINDYKLFFGNTSDFREENKRKKIIEYITEVLQ